MCPGGWPWPCLSASGLSSPSWEPWSSPGLRHLAHMLLVAVTVNQHAASLGGAWGMGHSLSSHAWFPLPAFPAPWGPWAGRGRPWLLEASCSASAVCPGGCWGGGPSCPLLSRKPRRGGFTISRECSRAKGKSLPARWGPFLEELAPGAGYTPCSPGAHI